VVINLMRTTRAVEESWTQYLKRTEGISPSQYNILRILRDARPKAVKISEISDRMVTRDPDVTRLVDRLIKQGLLAGSGTATTGEWCWSRLPGRTWRCCPASMARLVSPPKPPWPG
jgi:hypothetical protein